MKRLFLIYMLLWGCHFSRSEGKPIILVSIPPYAGFVKTLVGEHADIEVFVPPGVNPHTYEPSPDQVRRFTQAKVWFRTGDPIEDKMAIFLKQHDVEIIDLSELYPLMESHVHEGHEEKDLHLWMDPLILKKQITLITDTLAQKLPDIRPQIQEHGKKLETQLIALDHTTDTQLRNFQGCYLLVSHPALGYYAARYGLHQISVEIEGKDPLPQDIAHLMEELGNHPVPVILVEPQYNNKGALLIAQTLHIPMEEINPYAEDYFKTINHLTHTIVQYYGHSD